MLFGSVQFLSKLSRQVCHSLKAFELQETLSGAFSKDPFCLWGVGGGCSDPY